MTLSCRDAPNPNPIKPKSNSLFGFDKIWVWCIPTIMLSSTNLRNFIYVYIYSRSTYCPFLWLYSSRKNIEEMKSNVQKDIRARKWTTTCDFRALDILDLLLSFSFSFLSNETNHTDVNKCKN